jgi:TolA-binding protein
MTRYLWAMVTAAVGLVATAADPPKDTAAAAFTRTQKLKGKVTVEAKNAPLKDILKDISDQLDEQKLRPLSVQYDIGISQNTRTNLAVKDAAADEALDQLLKSLGYGYVVVSKDKDRYDGWIKVVKGDARGYEPGTEPKDAPKPGAKPTSPTKPEEKKPDPPKTDTKPDDKKPADPAAAEEEKTARGKLDSAKKLIADGKAADAKPLLKYVVKFHPTTAAAAEAKKVLDEMK